MIAPRNKNLIINPIFLSGLLVLALNDHFLKAHYPNWLTGKLSDFTGLLIFPLFLAFLFPGQTKITSTEACSPLPGALWHPHRWPLARKLRDARLCLLTGLCFIFWKSPASTPLILLYNKFAPIGITRIVDYTDLLALAVLPLSHRWIQTIDRYKINLHPNFRLQPIWLILPCSLIFMATSPPTSYKLAHNPPEGDIHIGTYYKIKLTPDQILDMMRKEGYVPRQDTTLRYPGDHSYIIENVTFNGITDTLQAVHFSLYAEAGNKTLLYVDHIRKRGNFHISDWQLLKIYTKYYDRLIKRHMVREFR